VAGMAVRYVITPEVAVWLVADDRVLAPDVSLVAPTLLRSQVVALLYRRVAAGELDEPTANAHLDRIRTLNIRLLGDRVLQRRAWRVAHELGWADTYHAEYVALTQLQADALVTTDETIRRDASALVALADIERLVVEATTVEEG
jgi:predicted nucleic acid-binding protein